MLAIQYPKEKKSEIYIIGGFKYRNKILKMSAKDWKWKIACPFKADEIPLPRVGHSIVHSKDHIIQFGGKSEYSMKLKTSYFYGDVNFFNIKTEIWEECKIKGTCPQQRAYHAASV